VDVPVIIKPGQTTSVHLDGEWTPPVNIPKDQIVDGPSGPMGWQAELAENTATK